MVIGVRAQLSVIDMRRAVRHPVDYSVIGEHRQLGDLLLHICNLSQQGFMADGVLGLDRGERITIRLPGIGQIEAHLAWAVDGRAGFQFERVIRPDDLMELIEKLQPDQRHHQSAGAGLIPTFGTLGFGRR